MVTETIIRQKEAEIQTYPAKVLAIPREANLRTARKIKECCVCHQQIWQGERYYSISYRIGVDTSPYSVHAHELAQFAAKNYGGGIEYPFSFISRRGGEK